MKAEDWNALAAWSALALGVANWIFSLIRPWWVNRKAHPEVSVQMLMLPDRGNQRTSEERIVVPNRGPAEMRDVTLTLVEKGGKPSSQPWVDPPPFPLPILYAGQQLYLRLVGQAFNQPRIDTAIVRWKDRRPVPQEQEIWLSKQTIV